MQTDLITKVYFNEHLTHSCVGMPQGLQALLSSYWWNVVWIFYEFQYWKNKILRFCFQYFMFSSRFMLFGVKFGVKKKFRGGGGIFLVFFRKTILSHLTFYAIFNIKQKKYWKVPLHLLVKWEVVSPNSREGQLEYISIISSIPLFWFCISNVGGGWGGGGGV